MYHHSIQNTYGFIGCVVYLLYRNVIFLILIDINKHYSSNNYISKYCNINIYSIQGRCDWTTVLPTLKITFSLFMGVKHEMGHDDIRVNPYFHSNYQRPR